MFKQRDTLVREPLKLFKMLNNFKRPLLKLLKNPLEHRKYLPSLTILKLIVCLLKYLGTYLTQFLSCLLLQWMLSLGF